MNFKVPITNDLYVTDAVRRYGPRCRSTFNV